MPTHQPIAGIAPATVKEVTVMSVWPSIASTGVGRWMGRAFSIDAGFRVPLIGLPITVGRLLALASIPVAMPLYFLLRLPRFPLVVAGVINPFCSHYRLTNRRVVVEHPFSGLERKSISLDRFDQIEVQVLKGQGWYDAGDLVFRQGPTETFRISAVPRPETFRQTCLKAHASYVGVQQARQQGMAV